MTSNIKLYIGDKLVEFDKQPDIYYNWTETDLSNPITTKNSFSKTITIEGTKVNNDIFGHFWNLERYQKYGGDTGVYFNPSYKVPFTLYINGNLFEKGYVKLEKINKTGNHLKYEVGLFGGLGSFLYNLSTNFEDGSVKTLGNLKYYDNNDEELDLDFTISRDTVKEAWDNIMNDNSKWSTINFGSFYTGIPDEIDTNKVLINVSGYPNIIKEEIVSGNTYQTYAGWSMGELDNNLNQFEVKDLRSYLQTPLIRVKSIFDSLCKPINSKGEYDNGYEVVLDTDFFNSYNPYYANTYMTLPQIPKLNFNLGGSGSSEYVVNDFTTLRKTRNNEGNTRYLNFELPQAISNSGGKVKLTLKPRVWVSDPDDGGQVSITPLYLMKQWIGNDFRYHGENRHGYAVQVYSVSDTDPATSIDTQTVLTGSSVCWYTAMDMTGSPFLYSQAGATPVVTGTDIKNYVGSWDHIEDGPTSADPSKYGFLENVGGITIETEVPAGTKQVRVWFRMYSETNTDENVIYQNNNSSANNHYSFPDIRLTGHDSDWAGLLEVVDYGGSGSVDIENNTFYSYKRITKEALLNTSYSVADWLMSYCKMFGLYIYKDKAEDKIYISTRNNFYNREKVEDLTGLIDSSKGVTINPLYVDSKFISLTTPLEKSTFSEQYKNSYGVDYGMKKVDTGFAFNSDCKELIKTSLKGAVDCNKQSIYNFKSADGINPYVFNGFKQTLYKNGLIYTSDTENPTLEYEIPKRKIASVYKNKAYNSLYPYYDIMQHICLENDEKPIATENVLVFYNGKKNVTDAEYYLTDDMTVMNTLNNKPCWVMTKSEYNNSIKFCNRIFNLPFFSRYVISTESTTGSSRPDMVLMSLDFGAVREIYVPNLVTNPKDDLYRLYYSKYYSDLYDVNTKVLECYIKPNKILTEEDMRHFYWFKNGIWRLNKITDYNPINNGLVKCQFIKVQDLENMTNEVISTRHRINVILDSYVIAASGGTISGMVNVTNYGAWEVTGISGATGVSVSPVRGTGDTNISISIPVNSGTTEREFQIRFATRDESQVVTITQSASEPYFYFTDSQDTAVTKSYSYTTQNGQANFETNIQGLTYTNNIASWGVTAVSLTNTAIAYTLPANAGESGRTGTIEIKSGNTVYGILTVEQDANLYMDVTTDYFIPATQSAITYSVSANPGCTLTLYDSNAHVISAITYSTGYYPSQQIVIGVNYGTNQRLFTLICQSNSEEVSPKNYTITQSGFEYYFTFNSSNTSALTKDIISTQQTINDAYSTNMSGLTVVSNNNWISNVSINASNVSYTVAKNEDTSTDRTGSISVKSGSTVVGTIIVNQAKADVYFIWNENNLSALTVTVGSGNTSTSKTYQTNCTALTVTYSDFVTSANINNGTATANYSANSAGQAARSTTIQVKYGSRVMGTLTISQQKGEDLYFIFTDTNTSITTANVNSASTSSSKTFTTNYSDLSVTYNGIITGSSISNNTVNFQYPANTAGSSSKTGSISVKSGSIRVGVITVNQAAGEDLYFKFTDTNTSAITINVASAMTYADSECTTNMSAFTFDYDGIVTGGGINAAFTYVTASFTANPTASARSGNFYVKYNGSTVGKMSIQQAGRTYSFYWNDSGDAELEKTVGSGVTSVTASYTTDYSNLTFSAETSAVTVVKIGETAITATFSTNTGAESRTMRIKVLNGAMEIGYCEITQNGQGAYFYWNDTNTTATTATVSSGNTYASKTYSTNMDSLTVSYSGCVTSATISNGTVTANFGANPTTSDRTGGVEVKYGNTLIGTFGITQGAQRYFVWVDTNTSAVTANVGSTAGASVAKQCNTNIANFSFVGDGTVINSGYINAAHTYITAVANKNTYMYTRTGTLNVKDNDANEVVGKMDVTQAAASYEFTWNDSQTSAYRPTVAYSDTSITAGYTTTFPEVTFSAETTAVTVTKNGSTGITATFSANTSFDDRTMRVLVLYNNSQVGFMEITQYGKPRTFKWNENNSTAITQTVGSAATSSSKAYTTDYTNLTVSYSGCVTSATISNGTVTANFTANPNTSARYGGVQVKYGSTIIGTYGITQQAKSSQTTRTINIAGSGAEWKVNMFNQSVYAGQEIIFTLSGRDSYDTITGSVYGDDQETYTAEMNGNIQFTTTEMGAFTLTVNLNIDSNGPRAQITPYQGNTYQFNEGEVGGGQGSFDTEGYINIPAGGDTTVYLTGMTWEMSGS